MNNALISPFERARTYVSKIPGAIEGNHGDCQTLAVANTLLWDFALDPSEAIAILREYNTRCSPAWNEAELIRKLQSAEKQPHSKPRGNLHGDNSSSWRPPKPKRLSLSPSQLRIDPATTVENWLKCFRCEEVDVWEASPTRPPGDWTTDGIELLEYCYRRGELINFVTDFKLETKKDGTVRAKPRGYGETVECDALMKRWLTQGMPSSESGGWIRMNPTDGQGVEDDNVTAYRWTLLESDKLPLDLLLSLFARLPLPIEVILTSAGRSFHAWVRVDAKNFNKYHSTVENMISLLARFGVDSGNKNPSRVSRLTGIIRRIGAAGDGIQRLLNFNPRPHGKRML